MAIEVFLTGKDAEEYCGSSVKLIKELKLAADEYSKDIKGKGRNEVDNLDFICQFFRIINGAKGLL